MLILFTIFLLILSCMVLVLKRNQETFHLFGMSISLFLMLNGMFVYIAKKGGISRELQNFLYFNTDVKTNIQYLLITLDSLGYVVAIGRYLFPLFLLLLAVHYSMIPWIRRGLWIKRLIFVMPIISLIIYYPTVFHMITKNNSILQLIIINSTYVWIIIYLTVAIGLLLFEAYSITMKIFQKQFILILTFISSLALLYVLYFGQDPAQIYQFHSADFIWKHGVYYLKAVLSVRAYTFIVLLNVIGALLGSASLLKYTQEIFESSKEGELIKQKSDAVSMGTSIFVHSIKNQLLANRVLFKRMDRLDGTNEQNMEQLNQYIKKLENQNENILLRMEELYNSVKTNQVHLIPVALNDIIENAITYFYNKHDKEAMQLNYAIDTDATVLADKSHLSEAVYNMIVNAFEAVSTVETEGLISLKCYSERLYNVIEIKDNGSGMTKEEMKKICEPFYSSKNTNNNWGMGLYYVFTIANEHFGSLRYESIVGEGSTFYLLLPKYKE